MEPILKAVAVYLVLLLLFRLSGKRTLAEVSPFDLVLLLIISEAVQQALVDTDNSMTNGFLLVVTLIGMNVLMSEIKLRSKRANHILDSAPLLIVENGKLLKENMRKERVDEDDILDRARELHGLVRLDQIRYAVIETNGHISIIPTDEARG